MVSLQTHNNSGRKKLVVTKAPEAKQIKGKDDKPLNFIEFWAKVEGEDVAFKYTNWTKSFDDFFKLDAVVECEVLVTDQKNLDQDGNPYKNRKITQVYQDGSPVKPQQRQWGKSPEIVAMEIDGKFRDTALMQACDMVKTGAKEKMTVDEGIGQILYCADAFYAWLKGDTKPTAKAPEKPVDKAQGMVQPAQEKAAVSPTESQTGTLPEFKDGTDLVNYALKHGFKLVSIKEALGIKTPADIKDVPAATKVLFPEGEK